MPANCRYLTGCYRGWKLRIIEFSFTRRWLVWLTYLRLVLSSVSVAVFCQPLCILKLPFSSHYIMSPEACCIHVHVFECIWCTFLPVSDVTVCLQEFLWHRKHTYVRLDGSSKISERRDMVADFQTRSDIFVFLLSTRAGGLGINLTAADTVSHWCVVSVAFVTSCNLFNCNDVFTLYCKDGLPCCCWVLSDVKELHLLQSADSWVVTSCTHANGVYTLAVVSAAVVQVHL